MRHELWRQNKGRAMRTEQEIFDELGALCASPGFIHVIAYFCMRDNMIGYAGDEMKAEDMANLYGHSRLIRTEISALLGLLIKHDIDYALPEPAILQSYAEKCEALLEEIHQAMSGEVFRAVTPEMMKDKNFNPFTLGAALRESIFYGAESAYAFQYRDFSPLKYGRDDEWLIANKGYSVDDGKKVVHAVGLHQNDSAVNNLNAMKELPMAQWTILPANEFSATDIAARAALPVDVVERVLNAFTLSKDQRNGGYKKLQDFNAINASPLIKRGDKYLLFNICSLSEAFYQSPFYWMWDDKPYRPKAMENRGKFTEEFSASRLAGVFGEENVYANVNIFTSKDTIAGEIDVLVIFGDRAIVLQAKSKQLTIAARQGDDQQLKTDFEKAIQASCNQGYSCAHLLRDPKAVLRSADGVEIALPSELRKIYVMCIVADHYPALSFQARQFLKFAATEHISPPFVMDVFLLDAMTEMLDSPLQLLSYVDRRTYYDDKFISSHELTTLGYHLKQNLWLDGKQDLVMLDDTLGTDLDLSMLVRRENVPGPWTPDGVLTRFAQTRIGKLVKQIEREPNPAMLALGFSLLTLGEDAVVNLSNAIEEVNRRAKDDGERHNISVQMEDGSAGLTVHCNYDSVEVASEKLQTYCIARKYAQKADRWFGLCLNPDDGAIRFGVGLEEKWACEPAMDDLTKGMAKPIKISNLSVMIRGKSPKIGRNDPCPCKSGKKYKKCCLQ